MKCLRIYAKKIIEKYSTGFFFQYKFLEIPPNYAKSPKISTNYAKIEDNFSKYCENPSEKLCKIMGLIPALDARILMVGLVYL